VIRRFGGLTLCLMLAGCSGSAPPAASAMAESPAIKPVTTPVADSPARYDGYGPVWLGMDEASFNQASFNQAWGGKLEGAAGADSTCFSKRAVAATPSTPSGFMFEDGRFVRYDVDSPAVTAPGGGQVGMDEARIRDLYGDAVQAQPHKYVDGATYLRIAAPQGPGALLFETDQHGTVTRWRVGLPPQVDYVEACG